MEPMVRLLAGHGVGVQHGVVPFGQHVAVWQHGAAFGQHVVGVQQTGWGAGLAAGASELAGWGGSGQHGTMCAFCGHANPGARDAAPAEPAIPRTQIAAAATRSESGTIKRRIR